jgi:erythromycin esterase
MSKIVFTHSYLLFLFLISCSFSGNSQTSLNDQISQRSNTLEHSQHLDALVEAASGSKLVLLGEASHGTHEYYIWRDSISRRLIAEKDFNFIAVEGDFASLYELNRYVKDLTRCSFFCT